MACVQRKAMSEGLAIAGSQSDASSQEPKKGALRDYVNKFGPETVQEMARVVSLEASQLIETQTVALFGDYRLLQEQMQVCVVSPLKFWLGYYRLLLKRYCGWWW